MKHSLMISWQRKEKFSLLGGMVLWEKCKHNYILFQQISSSLVCALRLLPSRLLPRSKALSESPCCAWMFWQAWELPGGIRQDPPGSWGCTLLALTAERRCACAPARLNTSRGHWCTQAPHPHLSTPGTLKLRGCSGASHLLTLLLERGEGLILYSRSCVFVFTGGVRWDTGRSLDLWSFGGWVNMQ